MSRRITCTDRKDLGTRGLGARGIARGLREPVGEIVALCLCQACRRTAARVRSLLSSTHHTLHRCTCCARTKTRKCVCSCSRTGRGPQVYCLMRFLEGFRFSTIFKPKNHRSVRSVARCAQVLHKHVDVTRAHARCKRHRHARMDAQLHVKAGGRSRAQHQHARTH